MNKEATVGHKSILSLVVLGTLVGVAALGNQAFARAMDGGQTGMPEAQKQQVAAKKAALEERLATLRAEHTDKLSAKRLAICEQRQTKINDIVERGTAQNKKQLAVFQKIEQNVDQFAADKDLQSDAISAAKTTADEKEAAAVAAIEASEDTTFDCASTGATNPGTVIKTAMTTRHDSLKAYRTAIKDLIVAVKHAIGDSKTTDTTEAQQ